jgi:hypothetical protein
VEDYGSRGASAVVGCWKAIPFLRECGGVPEIAGLRRREKGGEWTTGKEIETRPKHCLFRSSVISFNRGEIYN